MTYRVGQVVYLLSRKDTKVFPVQVIEEITRKKIDGEYTSYIVKIPNKKGSELSLDEVDAEVFRDAGELEKFMVDQAKRSIEEIIKNAQAIGVRAFRTEDEPTAVKSNGVIPMPVSDDDRAEIDLGNGLKAKVNIKELPL